MKKQKVTAVEDRARVKALNTLKLRFDVLLQRTNDAILACERSLVCSCVNDRKMRDNYFDERAKDLRFVNHKRDKQGNIIGADVVWAESEPWNRFYGTTKRIAKRGVHGDE